MHVDILELSVKSRNAEASAHVTLRVEVLRLADAPDCASEVTGRSWSPIPFLLTVPDARP